MTKQINIRADKATYEKIVYLLKWYDSKTKVLAVAIDRLYAEHKTEDDDNENEKPAIRPTSD